MSTPAHASAIRIIRRSALYDLIAGLLAQPCIDPEAPCPIVASLGALRSELATCFACGVPVVATTRGASSPRSPRGRETQGNSSREAGWQYSSP
jgi:hypothetical protein